MRKLACLLALLTLALCRGAEAKVGVVIRGEGYRSCGTWTKAQEHRQVGAEGAMSLGPNDIALAMQISWVLGYLSAFNVYVQRDKESENADIATGVDFSGLYVWIDNYCAAHPLDTILTATDALITELSKRKSQ
jgi:hypothetical protein